MSLAFLHSPAELLARLLVALGSGTDPENDPLQLWPVFDDDEPSLPDNCITVYDTTPRDFGRSMVDGERFQHYGMQVRVRGKDYSTAYVKAVALEKLLNETVYQNSVTIAPYKYVVWSCNGVSLIRQGKELPPTKRKVYFINLLAAITRTA